MRAEVQRRSMISAATLGRPLFCDFLVVAFGSKSWARKSAQDDRWSFCLTAGTL